MTIDEYFELLDILATSTLDLGCGPLQMLETPPADTEEIIEKLVENRTSYLTEIDIELTRGYFSLGCLKRFRDHERSAAFCVLFELEDRHEELSLKRSCDPYSEDQPLFKQVPSLWNSVRRSGKRDLELIDASHLQFDDFYELIILPGTKARLNKYLDSHLARWILENASESPIYFRVDPYNVSPELQHIILEAAIRPSNPKWLEELILWPGNKEAAIYTLEECSSSENPQRFHDLHIKGIGRLEVCFRRDNSGVLSGLIEEISCPCRSPWQSFIVNRCLHITSKNQVGERLENAVADHIDGAINVYTGRIRNKRWAQTLDKGIVCDASFRTHLFRIENISFKFLFPLSEWFFVSEALVDEWFSDQFRSVTKSLEF